MALSERKKRELQALADALSESLVALAERNQQHKSQPNVAKTKNR